MTWFCMPIKGPCQELVFPGSVDVTSLFNGNGSGTGEITISGPVGTRGNFPDDVVKIQDALNRVSVRQGGANPPLKVDGISGPKTKKAIQEFQIQHFGWKGADALIEPGKQTLAKLNQTLGPGNTPPVPNLSFCIQIAHRWIMAAQANLLAASLYVESRNDTKGPISVFDRESRMRAVNRHFAIDSQTELPKRAAFDVVRKVYDRMLQVFQYPGGPWGPAIFAYDSSPSAQRQQWIAYTPSAGFSKIGRWVRYKDGSRYYLDSIYLCPGFNTLWGNEMRAFVIVHELAHFVGYPARIGDTAYNWEGGGSKINHLQPISRLRNAENYANFAHETGTGSEALLSR